MNRKLFRSLLLFTAVLLFGQDFTRETRPADPRMYRRDIVKVQQVLLTCGCTLWQAKPARPGPIATTLRVFGLRSKRPFDCDSGQTCLLAAT